MKELYRLCSKSCLPPETKESWLKLLQRKTMFGNQARHVPLLQSHLSEECSYCYTRGLLPPPLETAQHFLLRQCPIVEEYVNEIMKTVNNPDTEEPNENSCPFLGPPSTAFTEVHIYIGTRTNVGQTNVGRDKRRTDKRRTDGRRIGQTVDRDKRRTDKCRIGTNAG